MGSRGSFLGMVQTLSLALREAGNSGSSKEEGEYLTCWHGALCLLGWDWPQGRKDPTPARCGSVCHLSTQEAEARKPQVLDPVSNETKQGLWLRGEAIAQNLQWPQVLSPALIPTS